jgi:type II secretory pathway predicted ATPase ExeA
MLGNLLQQDKAFGLEWAPPNAGCKQGQAVAVHANAAVQIARLLRNLALPQGHATLVGNVGAGKRTIARTAAKVASLKVLEVVVRPGNSMQWWNHQVQEAMLSAGVENK